MEESLIRKEKIATDEKKINALGIRMKASLSEMSQSQAGVNVLRYILYESRFLAPLTYETREGMNTDVLLQNEAKRMMYLSLRAHMDMDTIKRVEMEDKKQEADNGKS